MSNPIVLRKHVFKGRIEFKKHDIYNLLRWQEKIVLERSARLNLDPKIWRIRWNVLKEKMMLFGGKTEICWKKREKFRRIWLEGRNADDHLQKAGPSGWSFAKGWPIRMIICKRQAHPDDHLLKAGPSGWSFAKGRLRDDKNNNNNNDIANNKGNKNDNNNRGDGGREGGHQGDRGDQGWQDRRRRRRKRSRRRRRRKRGRKRRKIVTAGMDGIESSSPRGPKNSLNRRDGVMAALLSTIVVRITQLLRSPSLNLELK